jgi:PAS domain S-box-containing protein
VPQVIWTNDEKGKANYFNQRWYEYSGLSYEQSLGIGWEAIVHPDDARSSVKKWRESIAAGHVFESEYRLRDVNGNYRWHIGRNVPLKDSSGKVEGWFGSATDIENLKIAEQSYRDMADRLQLALDAGKLGSYEYDVKRGTISSTPQHRLTHALPEKENLTFDELKAQIYPADHAKIELEFQTAAEQRKIFETEYRICPGDHEIRWVKSVGRFLYNEQKEPMKFVGISVDITEQKVFTEELSKQVDQRTTELQRLNEDLLHFAHVVSHDLKEPVRKILAFNNKLVKEFGHVLPENGKKYLDKIERASSRMFTMIEGILTYSSEVVTDDSFDVVDLDEIISQIESDLEIVMLNKRAVIKRSALPKVRAIRLLIYQLFYNLINNSLKFSTGDETVISIAGGTEQRDGQDYLKIELADNGIGFEPQFNRKIFEIFSRLNPKDEYEGTGLGLALCKKIVDRHEGYIYAKGQPNKGATFTILLPAAATY